MGRPVTGGLKNQFDQVKVDLNVMPIEGFF